MDLKGENQIGRFRMIAERLASKITAIRGIAGIAIGGGVERGFVDRHSDIDILVFLQEKSHVLRNRILKLGSEEQKSSGIDIDIEVHFLEEFRKRRMDEIQKWDLFHVQVVFDPQDKIKRLLRQKRKVPRSFWIKRIVVCSEYLKWYCSPPGDGVGTVAEAWVERGDIVSAHYCVNYCLDLIVNIVYALNRRFVPPPKWKLFYSFSLGWLPNGYSRFLEQALRISVFSAGELERRLDVLRLLWQEILPMIEEKTGLTQTSMSRYFVEKVLHQA